ncbi:ribosomal-protein-alanine N-acetyltransferase [Candidatus Gastranaerophilus sp. (ex Termes propinquus)]|nr:ribosomal-protein-alanine N-acetyltransferase [Candidatus Gastranaerophilus sp. (ex Termes propinquus)]
MKIFIKNMAGEHLDEIMAIEEASYGEHHWGRESFEGEIKSDIAHYKCALGENGQCLGYMGLWKILDEAHITTIAIHPSARGRGIAQALIISQIETCLKHKVKYITLEVRKSNVSAISLYEKFGFKSLGFRKNYYQNNGEDALIMWTENIFYENFQALYSKNRQALQEKCTVVEAEVQNE